MSSRAAAAVLGLIAALSVARIVTTYRVFSETVDEPTHLAAGFRWLAFGEAAFDPEHPPLARVAIAIAPFVEGAQISSDLDSKKEGNSILYRNDAYVRNLAFVRAPILLFFLLGLLATALWARAVFGDAVAVVTAAMFAALPPLLAHGGLATTDMAAAATTTAALFAFAMWLRRPSWTRALVLGSAIGIGLSSKFSFPVFFSTGAFALPLAVRSDLLGRKRVAQIAVGIAIASLIVWTAYRFSAGTLRDARRGVFPEGAAAAVAAQYALNPGYEWVRPDIIERYRGDASNRKAAIDFVDWAKAAGYPSPAAGRRGKDTMAGTPPIRPLTLSSRLLEPFRRSWQWIAVHVTMPAPKFFVGWERAFYHASGQHASFLLGRFSDTGWWYYFPVVFFFKSPIAFLILAAAGVILLIRSRNGEAIGIALAPLFMMVPALFSSLNIGVRHILPIYPPLCIAAAFGVCSFWRFRAARVPVAALLIWFAVVSIRAHPDYLAYFNEFAGSHPERIASDSNLDWGQDLLQLASVVRDRHIEHLHVAYFGAADVSRHLPGALELEPGAQVTGWVAISEMKCLFGPPDDRGSGFRWLDAYTPVQRVGKSIRLYEVPAKIRDPRAK